MNGSLAIFVGIGSYFGLSPDVAWYIVIISALGVTTAWLIWKIIEKVQNG